MILSGKSLLAVKQELPKSDEQDLKGQYTRDRQSHDVFLELDPDTRDRKKSDKQSHDVFLKLDPTKKTAAEALAAKSI
jgi:hypothetical protein